MSHIMNSYPLVYFICVFPFSLTRWLAFSGRKVPHQAAAFTGCLFSLSGLFNVILFFVTRRDLITGGTLPNSNVENGGPPGTTGHDALPSPHSPPEHGHLPFTEDKQMNTYGAARPGMRGNADDYNGWHNGHDRGRSQQAESSGGARILPQKGQASESPATQMTPSTLGSDEDDQGFLPP
jgi:hypothetical protein